MELELSVLLKTSAKLSFPFSFTRKNPKMKVQLEIIYSISGFLSPFLWVIEMSLSQVRDVLSSNLLSYS